MKSLFTKLRGGAHSPPPPPGSGGPSSSSRQSQRPSSSTSTSIKDKENIPRASSSLSSRPGANAKRSNSLFKGKSRESPALSPAPLRSSTPTVTITPHLDSSASVPSASRPQSLRADLDSREAERLAPVIGLWPEEREGEGQRPRTVSAPGEGQKKVTFKSPGPTPTTSVVLDEAVDIGAAKEDDRGRAASRNSNKRSLSTSPSKSGLKDAARPPTSQSTTSARPRPTSRQSSPFLPSFTSRPPALRKASMPPLSNPSALASPILPYHRNSSPTKSSMLSPTPSEASLGGTSTRSYLPPPNSWSEMAEEDLIQNLSPRERTRQEVLWEIVSSEERYVQDLIKLNETFCRNILPPSAQSPHLDLFDHTATLSRTFSPALPPASPALSSDSVINLPIAAQYATSLRFGNGDARIPSGSSTSTAGPVTPNEDIIARGMGSNLSVPPSAAARMNAYNILTNGRPADSIQATKKSSFSSLIHGRSHHSMPPVPRRASSSAQETHPAMSSLHARLSYQPGMPKKLHKPESDRVTSASSITSKDVRLPEELEKVLMVLSGGIMDGHIKLAAALKRRYENQYPLVRSLADVFTAHSYVLREYNTYVLHLERALEQVDESLNLFSDTHPHSHAHPNGKPSKRLSKQLEQTEQGKLGRLLLSLEELATERGESGLIISLSKPFQRLLKYPLLFQNLLFNTDPSLREYEATLGMVDEVEAIVRQIEDEKSGVEEGEKTRDVLARIEGLERDRMLIAPKPNRSLISETQLSQPEGVEVKVKDKTKPTSLPPTSLDPIAVKQKKSFKRLSDILKGGHENTDLWVVRFSDVSLLCERTGTTQLPISSINKTDGAKEGKKYATVGKRSSVRPRNLYKFVKVHEWHLRPKTGSTDALLSMDDFSRARQVSSSSAAPRSPKTKGTMSTLPSIPGTPHRPTNPTNSTPHTGSTNGTPTRIPMKTEDGDGSPAKRLNRGRSGAGQGDTDTIASDRMSVMSFAFDSDQVKPNTHRKQPASPSSRGRSAGLAPKSPSRTGGVRAVPAQSTGLQRRVSGGHVAGHAANAKFAHRLRTDEPPASSNIYGSSTPGAGTEPRAMSRARRSLPPAMIMRSAAAAHAHAHGASPGPGGGSGSGSTPPSAMTNRPAWNSGGGPRAVSSASSTGSTRVPIGRFGSAIGSRSVGVAGPSARASLPGTKRDSLGRTGTSTSLTPRPTGAAAATTTTSVIDDTAPAPTIEDDSQPSKVPNGPTPTTSPPLETASQGGGGKGRTPKRVPSDESLAGLWKDYGYGAPNLTSSTSSTTASTRTKLAGAPRGRGIGGGGTGIGVATPRRSSRPVAPGGTGAGSMSSTSTIARSRVGVSVSSAAARGTGIGRGTGAGGAGMVSPRGAMAPAAATRGSAPPGPGPTRETNVASPRKNLGGKI